MKSQYLLSEEDTNCYVFTNSLVSGQPNVFVWGVTGVISNGIPSDLTNACQVATGFNHCVALREDGGVEAWGINAAGQTNVPSLPFPATSVAAGQSWSAAVLTDGSVVWWGALAPTRYIPDGGLNNVVSIDSAGTNAIVLDSYGNVTVLDDKVVSPTIGNAIAVSGDVHRYGAVLADGSVIQWGLKNTNTPASATNAWSISVGSSYTVLGRNDGTGIYWGTNGVVGTNVIGSDVESVSTGMTNAAVMVNSNLWVKIGSGVLLPPFMYPVKQASYRYGFSAAVLRHY